MAKKTAETPATDKPKCPITRRQFRADAKPLVVTVAGSQLTAAVKEFATGSLGWYAGDKVTVVIDGVPVRVQVGINLTVVNSKDAVEE